MPFRLPASSIRIRRCVLALGFVSVLPVGAQTVPVRAASPAEPWDVTRSLGFERSVEFETSEGTWMNTDVSPDGRTVAFDLLGDIYVIPIAGGDARRLTDGPAFDHLPRFSPDGRTILFVSDRSGADNIWLMNADGGTPRQITRETEMLPTNPVWTPDGEYIVVKRHVVDTRSLGGGEIWMYHIHGGRGAVLVRRAGFTSDINEPALSRDGRWVYYSHAGAFDYNRDPHAGIFQISRYDRETGRTEPVTRDPGGAARPVPSPDGRQLAFVRRVGLRTALVVRNLETGTERVVFEGLDRDQMETWTVHGAFPAFAWTPDSRRIIAPAEGRITAIDVARGTTARIPFRAHVRVPLTETVHFEQSMGPDDSLRVRVLRWTQITPDGRRLVFQAAGRIWQMALPDGRPQRVTTGERLEYAPAVSPDGRWIAFTTWSDAEGGALWRVALRAGGRAAPQRLTRHADQYANPSWSPDGRRIAFVQGSDRVNRGGDLAAEIFLRIRWVGASGGEPSHVTTTPSRGTNRKMPRISWAPDGQRIFFQATQGDSTVLRSVRLDGTDERDHMQHDVADEISVSPDGRWVAFREYQNIFVAPLPQVGPRPVTITSRGSPTPVKRLSRWGADWITWSPDSRSVTWNMGPTVVRQSLDTIFAEERRRGVARDTTPRDTLARGDTAITGETTTRQDTSRAAADRPNHMFAGSVYEVRLAVPRARPTGVVALRGARIITMRGDEVIENGTILVERNRITAVGPAASVPIPRGARIIDVAGKTIIPGLIDVHAHMGYIALDINPDRPWQYYANLAYGVTTTHDPSAATQFVFSNAELVEAGEIVGPRIFSTGFVLYGARNPDRAIITSLDDARGHVKRIRALGGFSVKSYNQLRRDARQWVIQAAREERVHVYPEGGSMLQQNITQFIDGHTGIEHALPVAELRTDMIQLAGRSGTGYTPTLIVGYGGVWGENYWYQVDDVFRNERLRRFTPEGWLDARARRRMMIPEEEFYHVELARAAKRILDAGGQIQLGAHGQIQGIGAHWELWMFEQGGMTPLEALRAATLAGARYLGLERDLGSLEAGKLADLVVLDANPLENIRNSERVHMVMKNGFLYDENVNEIWPRNRPRGELRR